MSTSDSIIALFCRVDTSSGSSPKHPQAKLHLSQIVTLALLVALKDGRPRAFYRRLSHNDRPWFPGLLERTRLFRLFAAHQDRADYF